MRKSIKTLVIIIVFSSICFVHVKAASSVPINDLIEEENVFDGQEVTIQGEAIGESMNRGDYSWININDGGNAIGIWLRKSEAEKVRTYGSYRYVGDTIEIIGTFHKACKEHGGEADLHAESINILKGGYSVKEHFDLIKIIVSILLSFITLIILIILLKIQKSAKHN
jgi:hypothetical protein